MSQTAPSQTPRQAQSPSKELVFIQLISRAMSAKKPADLQFIIANETLQLTHYRQAAFFYSSLNKKPILTTASGLVSVAENSPYSVWLNRFAKTFPNTAGCHRFNFADANPEHADG